MIFLGKNFLFIAVGAMPTLLAGYHASSLEWWAATSILISAVFMRDYFIEQDQNRVNKAD